MTKLKFILAILTLMVGISGFSAVQAQDVTLPTIGGANVSLASQKGKVVVLALGASWLPLSKNHAIITNTLAKKFAGRDVVFYYVVTDSSAAKSKNFAGDDQIQAFATRNKLTMPILRDSDGTILLKKYKVDQIPSFVILDKQGTMTGEPFGGVTPDAENALVDQIAAKISGIL